MAQRIGLIQRIQLDETSGCWNWRGARNPEGYGNAKYFGKVINAHRLAAILWLKLSVNDSRAVLHKCDNPTCFNPKHLFLGSKSDNTVDCVAKGRHFQRSKTHCKWGHPLEDNSHIVLTKTGFSRDCKTCRKYRSKRGYKSVRFAC